MIDWSGHVGERFGRLVIVKPVGVGRGRTGYECKCDCGGTKIVKVYQHLTRGKVKSCGCMGRERRANAEAKEKEKESARRERWAAVCAEQERRRIEREHECEERKEASREYAKYVKDNRHIYFVWQNMVQRCTNPTHPKWRRYGARGITVCGEWRHDFRAFCEYAKANGYRRGLTIDRVDNDGGYMPGNVRFVTIKDNCRNQSRTIRIRIEGKERPLMDVLDERNISRETYETRRKRGWSIERAALTPASHTPPAP